MKYRCRLALPFLRQLLKVIGERRSGVTEACKGVGGGAGGVGWGSELSSLISIRSETTTRRQLSGN